MEARQQRIAEMARMLLPCVEECRRKERTSKYILFVTFILLAIAGGYFVNEQTRPINSNEYAILSNLTMLHAQERNTTPEVISKSLHEKFYINHLHDLKARDWNDALNYLALKDNR